MAPTHQETIEEIRLLQYAKSQLEKATDVNDIIISVPGLDIKHIYHNKLAKAICRSIAHIIERYCLSLNNNSFFIYSKSIHFTSHRRDDSASFSRKY